MQKMNLEQTTANFISSLTKNPGTPLYELSPQEARDVLRSVQKDYETAKKEVFTEEISVNTENGNAIRLLITKPSQAQEAFPIIFYIHGGGWVMGDDITHSNLIQTLALSTNAAVVFPIYTPSPEAQYPQTTEDLFTALLYIAEYGAQYNLNPEKLAVAGDSVGANMATVMTMMAKQNQKTPFIGFQLLFYPVTDASMNTVSYQTFADGPWLTQKAMEWFWKQYAPNKTMRKKIYTCPLLASVDDLKDLPPALIITAENDVLRDEGEEYARKLNDAGVSVSSVRINGTIHDFVMLNALAKSAPTQTALRLAACTLRQAFSEMPHKPHDGN